MTVAQSVDPSLSPITRTSPGTIKIPLSSGDAIAPSSTASSTSSSSSSSSASLTGPESKGGSRRKNPPSRSVSPSNQSAGVLFRLSQEAIESICIGTFDHGGISSPSVTMLAGQPLPPSTRDYGFAYAAKERNRHPPQTAESSTPSPSAPDSPEAYGDSRTGDREDEEYRAPPKNKGRRLGHPPTPRNCISCGATKTPYWREAWSSSVLLCNACGLRYSKFRRRCMDCSYVPRKEDKGSKACTKCGGPWS